jgi:hypothetical protein
MRTGVFHAAVLAWGAAFFLLIPMSSSAPNPPRSIVLPETPRARLEPSGKIVLASVRESSGIAKSRKHDGIYWTHNDSGDTARIFAVRRDGSIVAPRGWTGGYPGIAVTGARNIDWEDICADGEGNLVIGDCGNNANRRTDLSVYVIPEPDPSVDTRSRPARQILFRFPDQKEFPPSGKNFDCEAVFAAGGRIYLLTKHRADSLTTLYRLDKPVPGKVNRLKLLSSFDVRGMVTAADATEDGLRLAVLTYDSVWVFEVARGDDYFNGHTVLWLPISAGQCEAVCFDGPDSLLITNEGRDVYSVPLSMLKKVR